MAVPMWPEGPPVGLCNDHRCKRMDRSSFHPVAARADVEGRTRRVVGRSPSTPSSSRRPGRAASRSRSTPSLRPSRSTATSRGGSWSSTTRTRLRMFGCCLPTASRRTTDARNGGFTAFTTTFEVLGTLRQLPGLPVIPPQFVCRPRWRAVTGYRFWPSRGGWSRERVPTRSW